MGKGPKNPREPDAGALFDALRDGDTGALARAITLVESRAARHRPAAREIMRRVLPHTGGALRIGLTGVPGAGKSTFIEAFGGYLCEAGHKLAVLAVDPTSSVSGGSILGDKTRMEELARNPRAFIRPSPSGKSAGGVAARTREALLLCEAAGFNVVLVETMGVGQGETEVRTMTDFFLLLQIAGAGDELQGIKKGVIELADAILINKADGDNRERAARTRAEYARVLHYLQPSTPGWTPRALTCSALEGEGLEDVWTMIGEFRERVTASGVFASRRREQNVDWFRSLLRARVMERFEEANGERMREAEAAVAAGETPVSVALEELLANSKQ